MVTACDVFINETKPWEQVKQGNDISEGLYQLIEALRHIALALLPIIPVTSEKILSQLGIQAADLKELSKEQKWGGLKAGSKVAKGDILFPRLPKAV
jgi:methionyl-tRNA synthetase